MDSSQNENSSLCKCDFCFMNFMAKFFNISVLNKPNFKKIRSHEHSLFKPTRLSSTLKKATWHGRFNRFAKQIKASATSILRSKTAAMKDIPWTC